MERNEIHKKYAFQYAYDKKGDFNTVNAFTDGFEACQRRINFTKPDGILNALLLSLKRQKSQKNVTIGMGSEDPEITKKQVSEYNCAIKYLTECIDKMNNDCKTIRWSFSDICQYLTTTI